jgi:sugar phosphate isomerase/epimerase
MQISLMLSNLHLPLEEALDAVVQMEVPAVQLTVKKEQDAATRRAMREAVAARGLKVSAICVDIGDLGETDSEKPLVEDLKPLMDAAVEMSEGSTSVGQRAICQTHVGIMPYTMSGARWNAFVKSCGELAAYGDEIGAVLAMETGPEPPRVMEALIKEVGSAGLGVNYDPANFIIWPSVLSELTEYESKTETPSKPYDKESALLEFEPIEGVRRLGPYIVHTHAKDARGEGGWGDVPLGTGWVDWPRYLRLLQEVGYDGYLAIEREAGEDRIGEIGKAAQFLKEQLALMEK